MSIPAPDEISIEDPLCNSSLGSMVTLDYVTPLTGGGGGGGQKSGETLVEALCVCVCVFCRCWCAASCFQR